MEGVALSLPVLGADELARAWIRCLGSCLCCASTPHGGLGEGSPAVDQPTLWLAVGFAISSAPPICFPSAGLSRLPRALKPERPLVTKAVQFGALRAGEVRTERARGTAREFAHPQWQDTTQHLG